MTRTQTLQFLVAFWAVASAEISSHAGGTPLTTQLVLNGLSQPAFVLQAPDGSDRMFIVEKPGRIKVWHIGGGAPTVFLDMTSIVNSSTLEWGLLGMTFHPDYANNGYLYVNYNDSGGNTVIARFTRNAGNPDLADFASRQTVLFLAQPSANHRGGWLAFGQDGYLYDSQGDGGGQNDPSNRAQNLSLLQGKILRIDVDADDFPADPNRNYAIPPDNPFAAGGGAAEIWTHGLRNPWRCSFDRETHDLWIADVGQNQREEIDFQPASSAGGQNYGWRCTEGTRCTGLTGCVCNGPTLTPPIFEYNHTLGVSITGGYVYRGCAIPDLRGTYFYADYQTSRIWTLRYDGATVTDQQERTTELDPPGALAIAGIASFGEDREGELYICDYNGGEIFKIIPNGVAPQPCILIGDMNCDGVVSVGDIAGFVLALTDPAGYTATYPACDIGAGDINGDSAVSVGDIGAFVKLLAG